MRGILQNRNLGFLWAGQVISQSGDSIFQIGLLWLALDLSASKTVTGLVAMAGYLPALLLALIAGVTADRLDRRRVMMTADLLRAVVVLAIPAAAWAGLLSPALLAAVAFGVAVLATFFNPARDAIIPSLVPPEGLVRANSLIQTSWQFSLLLGPALAGLLLHRIGLINLFTADAGAYLLSFACVWLLRPKVERPSDAPPRGAVSIREILGGWDFVRRDAVLLPLLLITIADNLFIMGPAIIGTPVMVRETFGGQAGDYALIMAMYAIGMLIGTAGLLAVGNRFGKGRILLVGMMLDGFTFIPYYFAPSLTSMAVVTVCHSVAIPLLTVTRASLIQQRVPLELRGRVFSLVNMAVVGMSAVSAGLSGVALDFISPRTLFAIIGVVGGLCGVIGWLAARELRRTR